MKTKLLSILFIAVCTFNCTSNSQTNWLDSQVLTQGPAQNNSKSYILFDTSGQGNMTKIYNSGTNQIKFIVPINDTMIQIIPK